MILRGLDVEKYTPEDLLVVFLGVSSYIAEQRGVQDRLSTMLSEDALSFLQSRYVLTRT